MRHALVPVSLAAFALAAALAGCGERGPSVSFSEDVRPILERRCGECHRPGGAGYEASGLGMTSYADLMAGTKFGPIVEPGSSLTSNLIILVEGRADPAIAMPHGENKLPPDEIATLRTWIDEGALDN